MEWERLRCSGPELAGDATANGDREAVNEKGDREAVNAVAMGYLDAGNRSNAAGGPAAPANGGYRVSLGRSRVQSRTTARAPTAWGADGMSLGSWCQARLAPLEALA